MTKPRTRSTESSRADRAAEIGAAGVSVIRRQYSCPAHSHGASTKSFERAAPEENLNVMVCVLGPTAQRHARLPRFNGLGRLLDELVGRISLRAEAMERVGFGLGF